MLIENCTVPNSPFFLSLVVVRKLFYHYQEKRTAGYKILQPLQFKPTNVCANPALSCSRHGRTSLALLWRGLGSKSWGCIRWLGWINSSSPLRNAFLLPSLLHDNLTLPSPWYLSDHIIIWFSSKEQKIDLASKKENGIFTVGLFFLAHCVITRVTEAVSSRDTPKSLENLPAFFWWKLAVFSYLLLHISSVLVLHLCQHWISFLSFPSWYCGT